MARTSSRWIVVLVALVSLGACWRGENAVLMPDSAADPIPILAGSYGVRRSDSSTTQFDIRLVDTTHAHVVKTTTGETAKIMPSVIIDHLIGGWHLARSENVFGSDGHALFLAEGEGFSYFEMSCKDGRRIERRIALQNGAHLHREGVACEFQDYASLQNASRQIVEEISAGRLQAEHFARLN